jgi:hypothetical protein
MYCICCDKNNVHPDRNELSRNNKTESELLWLDESVGDRKRTINNLMVTGGIIHIINAGYGSIHDGDMFILAICDECIKSKKSEASLLYYGNYMFNDFVQDGDVEKSKMLYNRRKNLDELL